MSNKILCPTDSSDHATIGLHKAIELAKLTGSHLTIYIVNITQGGARYPTISHWDAEAVAKLKADVEAIANAAGLSDVATVEVGAREAGAAIISYAEKNDYTQIVMGTGDKHGVKRLVLGSVASEVAGQAHCSVTIAR